MRTLALILIAMFAVGCASEAPKSGAPVQSGDYTSEPGAANKTK